ncbi:MAG: peptidase, partial [Nitrosopumilus sp.]
NDEIDNGAFIQALQYLVTTEVIVIPTTESSSEETQDIPDWIKNNACWWSQGIITDGDFVNAIQYLISKGIVSV